MTFPDSERVVYKEHTLSEVVCQLNFPAILAIASEHPVALQERLRERYPFYTTTEPAGGMPGIAELLDRIPGAPPEFRKHQFTTADGERTITLGPRLLSITEKQYVEWPQFRAEVEAARAALEDVYRPHSYTRVGLRYQDVIDARAIAPDSEWRELVNPHLIGLLGAPEGDINSAVREISSNVRLRLDGAEDAFVHVNHGLAQRVDEPTHRVYLIDADYFTERHVEGGDVDELLGYFNVEAGRLFRWAISDAARDALGRRSAVPVE